VNWLDGLLISHGDSGHVGGATLALADFSPRQIVDSPVTDRSKNRRALHAELSARGLGKGIYQRGDWLQISQATRARVLYPPGGIAARTADDKALVLQLESGASRVLFVFDSGFFTEKWLLENERDLRSDILIKGRHASDISGTMEFIDAVAPRAIVATATAHDAPMRFTPDSAKFSEEWAEQIAARGVALFRQDETGAVKIEIARDGFVVRGCANDQTFRSRAR
jgi:competence protein ComEC